MEIIDGEGGSGGHHHMWSSVVVEDCFNLLINLITDNHSNQKFFVETTNLLKKLCGYFNITTTSSIDLNNQQTQTNLSLILKLFRCLVTSFNSSYSSQKQQSIACQRAFAHFGLLIDKRKKKFLNFFVEKFFMKKNENIHNTHS